jgi:WD40 repeat protein
MFTPDSNVVHRHYEALLRHSIPAVILGRPASASGVVLTGHDGGSSGVQRASYSSGAGLLVSAAGRRSRAEIMVWDVQTGARLMSYRSRGEFASCFGVIFLPGKKEIVSVWSAGLDRSGWQLWRLSYEAGDLALVCPPHELKGDRALSCIAWAHDWFSVLCGTADGLIFRFSLDTGLALGEATRAHWRRITSLSFSPDGLMLASTSADGSFKIWNAASEKLEGPTFTLTHRDQIESAAFCPTNPSLLAVAVGHALHIYDIATGTLDSERSHGYHLWQIVYSPDGKYIATLGFSQQHIDLSMPKTRDGEVVVGGTTLETGHTLPITCLAFSPDQKHIIIGAMDQILRVDKLEDAGIREAGTGHQDKIIDMAFTLDGKKCATLGDKANFCLWDLETRKLVEGPIQLGNEFKFGSSMIYSSDSQDIIYVTTTNDIVFTNLKTKAAQVFLVTVEFPVKPDRPPSIHWLAIAPDNSALAVVGSVWFENTDTQTFLCIKHKNTPLEAPAVAVELNITPFPPEPILAYHPSGDYICFGDYAWELATDPPTRVTGKNLSTILKETFLVSFGCSDDVEYQLLITPGPTALTAVSFGSPVRQTFRLPPELFVICYRVHDGLIALGSYDGRVTVLDFTHLLTAEETALLSRIRKL